MRDSEAAARRERRALSMSIAGYLGMGALGLGFAAVTRSEAILFDGVYSLLNFLAALLAARVARLVDQPSTDAFPFGFAHFEPLLNVIRGFLILAAATFAFLSAVLALLRGGRPFTPGVALAYGVLAAVACLLMALHQRHSARAASSELLVVDARNWLLDALLSGVVAAAFLAAYVLSRTRLAHVVPYVDPLLVVVLVLAAVRMPLRTIRDNLRELLVIAPAPDVRADVRSRVETALGDLDAREIHLRPLKVGRTFYLFTHVLLPPERALGTAADLDALRTRVAASLSDVDLRVVADTVFTADDQWIRALDHRAARDR